jgi:hypothetical protein
MALAHVLSSLRAGGGCLITVRDYANEDRGRNILKPYGARNENGKRYFVFQIWDFDGDLHDLTFFFVEEDVSTLQVETHAMRSKYYAVSISTLMELMRAAGFGKVRKTAEQTPRQKFQHLIFLHCTLLKRRAPATDPPTPAIALSSQPTRRYAQTPPSASPTRANTSPWTPTESRQSSAFHRQRSCG